MITWLNGDFGAGKTTTANELRSMLRGFRIFDAETVGYMLRANLEDHDTTDFQHWPAWRALVVATAVELMRQTGENLIVPQTVLDQGYMAEVVTGLAGHGEDVFHVLLDADTPVLRFRIDSASEARQWRRVHLDTYVARRSWMRDAADLIVDTTTMTPHQAAATIAEATTRRLSR